MSQRDDLLAGAKQCLYEKGWARTTARDIAGVSGANLGSIGYHFGSKEALMGEALIEATDDWGQAVEAAMADAGEPSLETTWDRMLGVFGAHRGLWTSTFEALSDASPAVREHLEGMQSVAHRELAELFGVPESAGATVQALLLGAMAQQLIDPHSAPDGKSLQAALRALAG